MDDKLFLVEQVRASWRAHGAPGRIVAAVSGGADSVALLFLLKELAQREPIMLFAAHVNHGLREDAGEDAAFVADICQAWKIPCYQDSLCLSEAGENEAREARYRALFERCREAEASVLSLAHHRSDQAETVLLHLFRGSGSAGLGGMKEWALRQEEESIALWRPLLDTDPGRLRRLLRAEKISWREDSTNAGDDYLRNYIRHQVLPAVHARIPEAEEAVGRAARIFQDENDYLAGEAQQWLEKHACLTPPCRFLMAAPFSRLHPALQRRAVRLACPVLLDYEKTEAILKMRPGETLNLPQDFRACRTEKRLHFLQPERDKIALGTVSALPYRGAMGDGVRCQAFPKEALEGAELRFRRPGDRIRPFGAGGTKSLQDFWVDKKIDRPFRDYLPLLCKGERVLWSIGVGPGEEARVADAEENAVFLQYNGDLPGEWPGERE